MLERLAAPNPSPQCQHPLLGGLTAAAVHVEQVGQILGAHRTDRAQCRFIDLVDLIEPDLTI
jgi:hypothetical protein